MTETENRILAEAPAESKVDLTAPVWKFIKDGQEILVNLERWVWQVGYNDGSHLLQFDEKNVFHQFAEIEQDKIAAFSMISTEGKPPITMLFKSGMKLIHFYRNIHYHVGPDPSLYQFIRIYCFGYETATDKVILAILPDDSIAIVQDADEIQVE